MQELFSTRHNEMIDPALHVWGWEIPVYLFLGGLVAGIMIISGYFTFRGHHKHSYFSCFYLPHVSLALLSAGMLALFLDLEHKFFVWRLYTTFKVMSPMSWGAWILVLVYPTLLANTMVSIPEPFQNRIALFDKVSSLINRHPFLIKNIGVVNMIVGAILGMYTGLLLSGLQARPLWNSSMLWVLFLVSGLSSAAAFVHMITTDRYERETLAKADNGFLIFELFIFALFFFGLLSATRVHRVSAHLLLDGAYAPVFWVFVIGLVLVIPLAIQLLAVNHKVKHTAVAPILVITGGLILRFIIVSAGQFSNWSTAFMLK